MSEEFENKWDGLSFVYIIEIPIEIEIRLEEHRQQLGKLHMIQVGQAGSLSALRCRLYDHKWGWETALSRTMDLVVTSKDNPVDSELWASLFNVDQNRSLVGLIPIKCGGYKQELGQSESWIRSCLGSPVKRTDINKLLAHDWNGLLQDLDAKNKQASRYSPTKVRKKKNKPAAAEKIGSAKKGASDISASSDIPTTSKNNEIGKKAATESSESVAKKSSEKEKKKTEKNLVATCPLYKCPASFSVSELCLLCDQEFKELKKSFLDTGKLKRVAEFAKDVVENRPRTCVLGVEITVIANYQEDDFVKKLLKEEQDEIKESSIKTQDSIVGIMKPLAKGETVMTYDYYEDQYSYAKELFSILDKMRDHVFDIQPDRDDLENCLLSFLNNYMISDDEQEESEDEEDEGSHDEEST